MICILINFHVADHSPRSGIRRGVNGALSPAAVWRLPTSISVSQLYGLGKTGRFGKAHHHVHCHVGSNSHLLMLQQDCRAYCSSTHTECLSRIMDQACHSASKRYHWYLNLVIMDLSNLLQFWTTGMDKVNPRKVMPYRVVPYRPGMNSSVVTPPQTPHFSDVWSHSPTCIEFTCAHMC